MDRTPRSAARVLDAPLAAVPDREAVVGRSARLTYRQLDAAADRAATVLAGHGIAAGVPVAVSLPNDVDIVVAFHATMRLGGVWVGVNRNLAAAEKSYIIGDSGASVLLCDREIADQVRSEPGQPAGVDVVQVDPGDLGTGRGAWGQAEPAGDRPPVDPLAPAALAYTSGTTGRPKGVVHSQHNLIVPGEVLVATRGYDRSLRKGDCLPLTILNLIVLSTLLTSQAHGTSVVLDRLDAAGIAEQLRAERVTTWNGVPALLSSMARDAAIPASDLATLDEVWTGGDACPTEIRDRFEAKFGIVPTSTYGLTEAPTIVTVDDRGGGAREGASGRPLPHLRVTVRDDDGAVLPSATVGEVCVEAAAEGRWAGLYRPMLGYHGNPRATADVLRDGVLHTGDLGELDGDGFLTIRSRRNAVIIRGGANVYPAEVERVINEIPGVEAAAVFGFPDERLGERVAAAVSLEPGASVTADAVVERCAAQLARYKVPEQVMVLDQLPRNSMGKVVRSQLPKLLAVRQPPSAPGTQPT